jgi:putative membrane protein
MHLSLYGSALLLWRVLLDPARAGVAQSLAAGAISTLQMTFLGALLTLSPRLLFTPHLFTTADWGLSPLSDQQIGGLIMWVPGCFVFLGVTLVTLARSMAGRVPGSVGRGAPSESRS